MARVTYTAKRSLIDGHVIGNSYSFDFGASRLDHIKNVIKTDSKSDSGRIETVFSRIERGFSVSSPLVEYLSSDFNIWIEFLDSIAATEPFTFDPYGTLASPASPAIYKMDGDYKESREGIKHFTFSFDVKIVP